MINIAISVLIVDGTDLTKYIKSNGYKLSRTDFDGPGTNRLMDLSLHRDYIGYKIKIECTCKPLDAKEMRILENVLRGKEQLSITYKDFSKMETLSTRAYNTSLQGSLTIIAKNDTEIWNDVSFNIIEM